MYTITGGFVAGTHEYTLPYYITNHIEVERKGILGTYSQVAGDVTDQVWDSVSSFEVYRENDGTLKLWLDFAIDATEARVIWWAPVSPIFESASLPTLNATISATDTFLVLSADLPYVGNAGFVYIGKEWIQFSGSYEDDTSSFTKLDNLERSMQSSTAASHNSGSTVTMGIPIMQPGLQNQLLNQARAAAHLQILGSVAPDERDRHMDNYRVFQQMAEDFWPQYNSLRNPRFRLGRNSSGPTRRIQGPSKQPW